MLSRPVVDLACQALVETAGRDVVAHLANALTLYDRHTHRNAMPVPADVDLIADCLTNCAKLRQSATPLDGSAESGNAPGMTTDAKPLLLTKGEAAVLLGMSLRTLDRLIADGQLPAVRLVPGKTRIKRTDLEDFLDGLTPVVADLDDEQVVS